MSGIRQQDTNTSPEENICYLTLSRRQVSVYVDILEIIILQKQAPNLQYPYLSHFQITVDEKPPLLQTKDKKTSVIHGVRNSGPQRINAAITQVMI